MAISQNDLVMVVRAADGKRVAVPVTTDLAAEGLCVIARTADGIRVPVVVSPMVSAEELGILARTADGERVPVVFARDVEGWVRPNFWPDQTVTSSGCAIFKNGQGAIWCDSPLVTFEEVNPVRGLVTTGSVLVYRFDRWGGKTTKFPSGEILRQVGVVPSINLKPLFPALDAILSVASSEDGKHIAISALETKFVIEDGEEVARNVVSCIFSHDSGETWDMANHPTMTPANIAKRRNGLASPRAAFNRAYISDDGQVMIVNHGNFAMQSNNGGASFFAQTSRGPCAMSADGNDMIFRVAEFTSDPVASTNGGSSFFNLPINNVQNAKINSDGSMWYVVAFLNSTADPLALYKSTDKGANWSKLFDTSTDDPSGFPVNPHTFDISDDGQHIYIRRRLIGGGGSCRYVYSNDGGDTWEISDHAFSIEVQGLNSDTKCSRDGRYVMETAYIQSNGVQYNNAFGAGPFFDQGRFP